MKRLRYYIMLLAIVAVMACDNTPVIEVAQGDQGSIKENLINANRYIASAEKTQIDGFVARRQWNMQHLPCGALYEEYEKGSGGQIDYEDNVEIQYTLSSLTGVVIYNQRTDTVVVGRRQTVTGLDEALLRLRRGSKAHVIVPSESGYGVVGDGDRIPSRTVLVYDVENIRKIEN